MSTGITRYDVVSSSSWERLKNKVEIKINEGWQPFGSPVALTRHTVMQVVVQGKTQSAGENAPVAGGEYRTAPDYFFVITLAGQSNAMAYGEGMPLPDTLDAPDARIKQLARRSSVTPGGEACAYNDIIPADHCLHDVQDMSGLNHPRADPAAGQYGCVGQGLHIAKKLLPYIPDNAGILLVPCCRGGSAFTQGSDGTFSETSGATEASARWGVGKPLYRDLISRTKAALDNNPKNRLLAVVWMQGEFDMAGANYAQQPALFTQMVQQFRTELASHLAQLPECSAENVPWICGDTTHYWKDTYPAQYEAVYGSYRNRESENIFFVPFMYEEDGSHTPTNAVVDDPDIAGANYSGSASRTSANWTSSLRASHFSSWARRGIVAERLAAAILLYGGRKSLLAAPVSGDSPASGDNGTTGTSTRGYTPQTEQVGYNGRRGDGSLEGQGWSGITGATITVSDSDDGKGGHFLGLSKSGNSPWMLKRSMQKGGDLLRYGGRLTCRFRLTGNLVSNRYAFAFYWRIAAADIPSGAAFADSNQANTKPFVMSFFIQTDGTNINLMHHKKTNAKLGTFGAFDNEWHTLEILYPGNGSTQVTPVFDGVQGTPFTLAYSNATSDENVLMVTDITSSATYPVNLSAFDVTINRDDGTVTLSDEDVSSYVYFPAGSRGGRVIIPDAAISTGNTVQIVANNAGTITIEPASNNVLITPKGESEGLPSSTVTESSVTLVQTGADGKSWVIT